MLNNNDQAWMRDATRAYVDTSFMKKLKESNPSTYSYFVGLFEAQAKPEDVLEKFRDEYERSLSEVSKS